MSLIAAVTPEECERGGRRPKANWREGRIYSRTCVFVESEPHEVYFNEMPGLECVRRQREIGETRGRGADARACAGTGEGGESFFASGNGIARCAMRCIALHCARSRCRILLDTRRKGYGCSEHRTYRLFVFAVSMDLRIHSSQLQRIRVVSVILGDTPMMLVVAYRAKDII